MWFPEKKYSSKIQVYFSGDHGGPGDHVGLKKNTIIFLKVLQQILLKSPCLVLIKNPL